MSDEAHKIYLKLLDPEILVDYNPENGGMRIGVAGLAGLPLGDVCVYKVKA